MPSGTIASALRNAGDVALQNVRTNSDGKVGQRRRAGGGGSKVTKLYGAAVAAESDHSGRSASPGGSSIAHPAAAAAAAAAGAAGAAATVTPAAPTGGKVPTLKTGAVGVAVSASRRASQQQKTKDYTASLRLPWIQRGRAALLVRR